MYGNLLGRMTIVYGYPYMVRYACRFRLRSANPRGPSLVVSEEVIAQMMTAEVMITFW